ncbi:MAG: hypothetical protein EBY26_06100, partial [Microbacteriaceae bacterium]|nr:hypothetical protein [Microbacteriaceae bacterium]
MALLDYLVLVAPGSANKKTPAQAHGVEKLFRAKLLHTPARVFTLVNLRRRKRIQRFLFRFARDRNQRSLATHKSTGWSGVAA